MNSTIYPKREFTLSKTGIMSDAKIAEHQTFTLDEFEEIYSDYNYWFEFDNKADKKRFMPLFIAGKCNDSRSNENTEYRSCILMDIDNGENTKPEDVITFAMFEKLMGEYDWFAYSSFSNCKEYERFRVVLPLAEDIPGDVWQEWRDSIKAHFPWIKDTSCFTLSQPAGVPCYLKSNATNRFYKRNHGKNFNLLNEVEFIGSFKPSTPVNTQLFGAIGDADVLRVLDDVIANNQYSFDYKQSWHFAQVMLSYGINDPMRVQAVQQFGAETKPEQHLATLKTFIGLESLDKYLPAGYQFPKLKKQKVNYSFIKPILTDVKEQFDYEFWLKPKEYLSDVANQFEIKPGVNLLIADCNAGKTHYFSKMYGVKMVCPLLSIVAQNSEGRKFNDIDDGVSTYQQLDKIFKDVENHHAYKNQILVVDEAHGLYLDGFKAKTNKLVHDCFALFKSVILMSGTIEKTYFSNLEVVNTIRVHKEQSATKYIKRVGEEKDLTKCAIDIINECDDKMLVLFNDKKEVKAIRESISKHSLEITADTKGSDDVKQFLETALMGDYDVIIGTNSVVEGMNIIDKLDSATVLIVGECSSERIEQVANRFRKVETSLNVVHIRKCIALEDIEDVRMISSEEFIEVARDNARSATRYVNLLDSDKRRRYINTFRNEARYENIFWNEDTKSFDVAYTKVDYEMSQNRLANEICNFEYYVQQLSKFGFEFVLGEHRLNCADLELKNTRKDVKEQIEFERVAVLDHLLNQYEPVAENSWDLSNDNDLVKVQRLHVENLVKRGLDWLDVPEYLEQLKGDGEYWKRVSSDISDARNGNSVRDFIMQNINQYMVSYGKGKSGLTGEGKRELAERVALFVLKERFGGDLARMALGGWGGLIVWSGLNIQDLNNSNFNPDHLLSIKGNTPDRVLEKYITLGKTERPYVNGKRQQVTPLLNDTLTPFTYNVKRPMQSKAIQQPANDPVHLELVSTKPLMTDAQKAKQADMQKFLKRKF